MMSHRIVGVARVSQKRPSVLKFSKYAPTRQANNHVTPKIRETCLY